MRDLSPRFGVFQGNDFSDDVTLDNIVLSAGRDFLQLSDLEIASAHYLEIPATTTLEIVVLPGNLSVVQQTFTASGTYTPSPGMIYCIVECVGSGGGGGGAAGAAGEMRCGSGGGSGGYSRSVVPAFLVGASQAITISAAGAGGAAGDNPGGPGGDASFGTYVIAKGGQGGNQRSITTAPGAGGVIGTGQLAMPGRSGLPGMFNGASTAFAVSGGAGGDSFFGAGGAAAVHITTQTGTAGVFGGGGQGGSVYNVASNVGGGAGGNGVVVVTEVCNKT